MLWLKLYAGTSFSCAVFIVIASPLDPAIWDVTLGRFYQDGLGSDVFADEEQIGLRSGVACCLHSRAMTLVYGVSGLDVPACHMRWHEIVSLQAFRSCKPFWGSDQAVHRSPGTGVPKVHSGSTSLIATAVFSNLLRGQL